MRLSIRSLVFSGILALFFLVGSHTRAFSSVSMTPSTMTPSVQATYLLAFTPSVAVPASGSIEVAMQTSFTWPGSLGTSDMELTVSGVSQSLSGVLFGGYTITNPGTNQLTLTLPSSKTILTGSPVTLLLGRQANFYNPTTAGNHSFSVATRDASGNLLESSAGIILIQDARVGVSGEYPTVWGSSDTVSSQSGEEGNEGDESGEESDEETAEEEPLTQEETQETEDVIEEPTFDVNDDGVVDTTDMNVLLEYFESYPDLSVDYNLDGEVDLQDFSFMLTALNDAGNLSDAYAPPQAGEIVGDSVYASRFVVGEPLAQDQVVFRFEGEDTGSGLFQAIPVSFRYAIRDDLVIVHALVDTGPSGLQASDVTFTYDADLLELEDVYRDDSVFSIWASQPYEVSEGRIRFVAGTPNVFIGSNGYIATFEFVWKQDGLVFINYLAESVALLPNAAWLSFSSVDLAGWLKKPVAIFSVEAVPRVVLRSSSHSNEGQWSQSPEVSIEWDDRDLDHDGDVFWYALTQHSSATESDLTSSTSATSSTFDIPTDGRWYVHVLRERDGLKSDISMYELAIDREPPLPFTVTATTVETVNGEQWMLSYHAQDETSGVKEYWIQGSQAQRTQEEHVVLPPLSIGYHVYQVHAIDRSGNMRTQEVSIISEEVSRERPWQLVVFVLTFFLLIVHCMRGGNRLNAEV